MEKEWFDKNSNKIELTYKKLNEINDELKKLKDNFLSYNFKEDAYYCPKCESKDKICFNCGCSKKNILQDNISFQIVPEHYVGYPAITVHIKKSQLTPKVESQIYEYLGQIEY